MDHQEPERSQSQEERAGLLQLLPHVGVLRTATLDSSIGVSAGIRAKVTAPRTVVWGGMVTHIVLFKLKDRSEPNILETREVLTGMAGRIASLQAIEVGVDRTRSERSFDLALTTRHEDWVALEAYRTDPVHQRVIEYMRQVVDTSVAVDYEE